MPWAEIAPTECPHCAAAWGPNQVLVGWSPDHQARSYWRRACDRGTLVPR